MLAVRSRSRRPVARNWPGEAGSDLSYPHLRLRRRKAQVCKATSTEGARLRRECGAPRRGPAPAPGVGIFPDRRGSSWPSMRCRHAARQQARPSADSRRDKACTAGKTPARGRQRAARPCGRAVDGRMAGRRRNGRHRLDGAQIAASMAEPDHPVVSNGGTAASMAGPAWPPAGTPPGFPDSNRHAPARCADGRRQETRFASTAQRQHRRRYVRGHGRDRERRDSYPPGLPAGPSAAPPQPCIAAKAIRIPTRPIPMLPTAMAGSGHMRASLANDDDAGRRRDVAMRRKTPTGTARAMEAIVTKRRVQQCAERCMVCPRRRSNSRHRGRAICEARAVGNGPLGGDVALATGRKPVNELFPQHVL